jgi:hypothetical protein
MLSFVSIWNDLNICEQGTIKYLLSPVLCHRQAISRGDIKLSKTFPKTSQSCSFSVVNLLYFFLVFTMNIDTLIEGTLTKEKKSQKYLEYFFLEMAFLQNDNQ